MIRNKKPFTVVSLCLMVLSAFVFTLSCSDKDDEDDEPEVTELRFVGKWNGNLGFENIDISMRMTEVSTNAFEGDFYVSNNYRSCCNSGESDGTVSYSVVGSDIVDFLWNDVIPGCTGTFSGSGTVLSGGNLTIDLTGTDCDGDHIAVLTLTAQ